MIRPVNSFRIQNPMLILEFVLIIQDNPAYLAIHSDLDWVFFLSSTKTMRFFKILILVLPKLLGL